MVEVFKTNVQDPVRARQIVVSLQDHFAGLKVNFDLDDCDKILRIESETIDHETIIFILVREGYSCEMLL